MLFKPRNQSVARQTRLIPLQAVLLIPFVLQTVSIVGLVGYLSFRNGQAAVNDLASKLRSEVTARIERELQVYFTTPHDINQLNVTAFAQDELDLVSGQQASQLLQQLRISPFIYAIYCGDEQGQYLGSVRLLDEYDSLGLWVTNESTNEDLHVYHADRWGERGLLFRNAGAYDPRLRPWYKAAVKSKQTTWSEVYLDFSTQIPTVTASQPVYDRQSRQIVGVCATDVLLTDDLRKFLANLTVDKAGQAFILDRTGALLSTSTDDPLTVGEGTNTSLFQAISSQNLLVSGTTRYLLERFGSFTAIRSSQQLKINLGGERQLIQVLPFNDGRGLDWLIVVVIPEATFMEQINANTRTTILVCILALLLAIGLGIVIARRITHPLLRLSQASSSLATGNLEQTVETEQGIQELVTLAESFNTMAEQLRTSFNNLAQANQQLEERVTERTAQLGIAEEKYRSIFENAAEGIFQSSPTQGYISANFALANLYGYESPEALVSELKRPEIQLYVAPNRRHEFITIIEREGAVFNFESQIYRTDGSRIWISENVHAVRDDQGNLLYYEGTVQDITLRKQAEQALERRVARDALLSQISQQLVDYDIDISINFALQAIGELTESDRCYLINFDVNQQIFQHTHEWYAPGITSLIEELRILPTTMLPWYHKQYKQGKVINISHYTELPSEAVTERTILERLPIESVLMVPMLHLDTIAGMIGLDMARAARQWSDEDIQLLRLAGKMIAIAQARHAAETALRMEQKKSERLLLNILPEQIAQRLKQDQQPIAEQFDEVSILFADIVGFTPLSSRLPAVELVNLLNEIFSNFDELAEFLGLEKIKTIGDAYMVAAGLPVPIADHAEAIADMALAMQTIITHFEMERGENFKIRIGINTGSVIAGVIGVKKFIYDLWGDAVNVASRMESSGEPGQIQVTQATYNRLKEQFVLQPRGLVSVKGKGEMPTYWLKSRR